MARLITDLLGIRYPIIQGAMAWISDGSMAAAVSLAGGAGIIAAGGRSADYVSQEIKKARALTDRPFGVNIMLMADNKDEVVAAVCEEKPAFVTLGAGNPVPFFSRLHEAGIKVVPVIPNVRLAERVAASGADAVIAEGMEAGGHIGSLTTMALLTQVIPAVDIPVIMAGGFADGRGLAAALVMGAAGIQMGTRFLLVEECPVHINVKKKLIEAVDTDSIVTGMSIGSAVRGLKNKFSETFVALERAGQTSQADLLAMAVGTNKLAAVDGDVENGLVQAGQSLRPLHKIEPVKDIIDDIMAQASRTLSEAKYLQF